jgi:nondiscriminating glutamyl-tRNA synthetase
MSTPGPIEPEAPKENPFTGKDVLKILRERGWLSADPTPEHLAFCGRAAALLGPHVNDAAALGELLQLIFHYDAQEILWTMETHAVLARYGARDVVRQLSLFLLDPAPFDSDRFKELVTLLKEKLELRGRDLFHPLRLVLAGRAGEGELDRVILLLEEGAALAFAVPVKSARTRCLEFCAALD